MFLEDLITCSICHDVFNDPYILQCTHTFCRACITKWIQEYDWSYTCAKCPLCGLPCSNSAMVRERAFADFIEQIRPRLALLDDTSDHKHGSSSTSARRGPNGTGSRALLQCPYCSTQCKSDNGMKMHIDSMHNFPCTDCKETLSSRSKLRKHGKECSSRCCPHCAEYFQSVRAVTLHIKSKHEHPCGDCKEMCRSAASLQQHMEVCSQRRCPHCSSRCNGARGLAQHIQATHVHNCNWCRQVFTSARGLGQHIRNCPNRHFCDDCQREFNSAHALWQHTRAVHWYQCNDCCSEYFETEADLDRHQYPYQCPHCTLMSKTAFDLNCHIEDDHPARPEPRIPSSYSSSEYSYY
jgi:RING-type zinc-finger/Zinc finger, C2H2 type